MKMFARFALYVAAAVAWACPAVAQDRPDWKKPVALQLPDGQRLPARNANLDLDGPGKGTIGVYLYGRQLLEPNRAALLGPNDIGALMERVDELTGKSRFGRVINVPAELLDATIYDPGSGRMRQVSELEARRREQAARTGGGLAPMHPLIAALRAKDIDVDALAEAVSK